MRIIFCCLVLGLSMMPCVATAEESASAAAPAVAAVREEEALLLFDDQKLLEGYFQKYQGIDRERIIQMMDDESLSSYQLAAVIRVYRQKYLTEVVADDKKSIEHVLLKCLTRSPSPFVQVETMNALVILDRYQYFPTMVPQMIQKMDHYNDTVSEMAFNQLNDLLSQGPERSREAQIVFNTLKKILFLSRKRLTDVREPDERLSQKLKLLRWSIKILGTEDLDKLPKEVIGLL